MLKYGIQIQVYNINNEIVTHFGQFILVQVKKNLRNSRETQFREKLRKLTLKQNYGYLIKTCICK